MKHMQYKGHLGSTEVSIDDGVLFGKLLFIRDLVTYEADSPSGLKASFESAVDDYISDCEVAGREPDKPFKGQFNVRIASSLHRGLAIAASTKDVSLNEYIETILSCHEHLDAIGHVKKDDSKIVVVLQESGRPALFATMVGQPYVGQSVVRPSHKTHSFLDRKDSRAIWNVPPSRVVQ